MTTILALSGSLRKASWNTLLLRAAAELAGEDVRIELATIRGIPLYDGDLEATEGVPGVVTALKTRIMQADGLLIATPEYNNSIPGVLKNAIDWLSRPPADIPRVFGDLPVAVTGATPGAFGTALAQDAWLSVLRTLRTHPWFGGRLMVPRAGEAFDDQGRLTDPSLRRRLQEFVQGFADFTARERRPGAHQT